MIVTMPPEITRWKKEIEEITNDVTDLIENQHVFHRLGEIIQANSKLSKDNFFWDHLRANYGAAMVIGIARQVDGKAVVISLVRLLKDIERNHNIITKSWFADQYTTLPRQIGEAHFVEHFGTGAEIDVSLVKKDINDLSTATKTIQKFRHTRIAHKNKDKTIKIDLSFQEVDNALALLEKLVIKYQLLLNQAGFSELMPSIHYNWEEIFRVPWINDSEM